MAAVNEQNSYPKLSPADLADPTLFRLQNCFDFLYSQIDQTQNNVTTIQKQIVTINSISPAVPVDDSAVTFNGGQVTY